MSKTRHEYYKGGGINLERLEWKLKRIRNGLTLSYIADIIGCSPSLLSHYERDVRNISDTYKEQYEKIINNHNK